MANPFDQFDTVGDLPKAKTTTTAPSSQAKPNPFDNPAVNPATPTLSDDEFAGELYRKLNSGERPDAILQWASSVGKEIQTQGQAGEDWLATLAERDRALAEGRPGVYGRVNSLQEGEDLPGSTVASLGAMARKAGNVPLFYFGDEAVAAGQALAQDGDYWQNFNENWRRLNARDQTDEALHPTASAIGEGLGMVTSMAMPGAIYDKGVKMLAPKATGRAANLFTRSAVGTATGAAAGATAATGEGSVDNRFQNTGGGAVLGAGIGAAFPLVAAAAGRIARPLKERIFGNSSTALSNRLELTEEELAGMEAELVRQQDLGLNPTLLDVLPERARNVIGAAGVHDAARADLQNFARSRQTQLPERVQRQADEVLLPSQSSGAAAEAAPEAEVNRFVRPEVVEQKTVKPLDDDTLGELESIFDETAFEGDGILMTDDFNYLNKFEAEQIRAVLPRLSPEGLEVAERYLAKRAAGAGSEPDLTALRQKFMEQYGAGELSALRMFSGDHAEGKMTDLELELNLHQFGDDIVRQYVAAFPDDFSPEGLAFIKRSFGDFEPPVTATETPSIPRETDPALLRSPTRMKEELDATRKGELDARMEPIRHNPVPLTDEVVQVLSTGQGQSAIRDAIDMEADPALRQQLVALADNVKMIAQIDPRMPANTRQQITRQIMQTSPFTVNASEKISRALSTRASGQGIDSGTLNEFSRLVRDAARSDPDFIAAMGAAQAQHQGRESVELGEQFLSTGEADDFVRRAEGLADEPTAKLRLPEDEAAAKVQYSEDEVQEALNRWQGSAAYRITQAVERGGTLTPEDAKTLAIITRLVNSERIGGETLFRGFHADHHEAVAEILNRGNKAPKSHTANPSVANQFTAGPENSVITEFNYSGRGLDLRGRPDRQGVDRGAAESEVILPPGKFIDESGQPVTAEQLRSRTKPSGGEFYGSERTPRVRGRYVADPLLPDAVPAPSNRDLARVGAAGAVRRAAGQGPSEASGVASRFFDSPEQRRRTDALIGSDAANNMAERMQGEVERVYRATRQATREGPANEGGVQAVENFANALYQPGSPVPWTREVARFLHRIGMREEDAKWIVTNAIDESKTGELIKRLEKHGMSREQAITYVDTTRDALVKYLVAQEGGSE